MAADAYLLPSHPSTGNTFEIPDLVFDSATPIELMIVLESPHHAELASRTPMTGLAGSLAFQFLTSSTTLGPALGPVVKSLHMKGDGRIAIINVSQVPLQRSAFDGFTTVPAITTSDWDSLAKLRTRRAHKVESVRDHESHRLGMLLVNDLQMRVSKVTLSPNALVAVAGAFAQRHWQSLTKPPAGSVLHVPHPSMGHWGSAQGQNLANLVQVRQHFLTHTP